MDKIIDKAPIPKFKGRPTNKVAKLIKEKKEEKALAKKMQNFLLKEIEMESFLAEYIKNGGNATDAVLKIKPHLTYATAANMGSDLLKDVKNLGRIYAEKQGWGYGKLIEILMKKAETSDRVDFIDRLFKIMGYEDFITKELKTNVPQVVNIVQAQKQIAQKYVEGEVVNDGVD